MTVYRKAIANKESHKNTLGV